MLSIAIALVFVIFVNYGMQTFWKQPMYEDYCGREYYPRVAPVKDVECEIIDVPECSEGDAMPVWENGCIKEYECSMCRQEYEKEREGHSRIVFVVMGLIGLGAIALSMMYLKKDVVANGIMGGGVLSLLVGSIRYWGFLEDITRFITLGLILALLIYIGYKKVR